MTPRTPYVQIDTAQALANITRGAVTAKGIGRHLRPHVKSHRLRSLVDAQAQAGAIGFTAATLAQARLVRSRGYDVLLSSPVQLDAAARECFAELDPEHLIFSASSRSALQAVADVCVGDSQGRVVLDVDVGCDRGGLDPEECPAMARTARSLGLDVVGVMAYPGQAYTPGAQRRAIEDESRLLAMAAAALRADGVPVAVVSAGSSPTLRLAEADGIATEHRAGTYVFGDRQQVALGACSFTDISLSVVSTVIAHRDGQIVIDAGGKALGRDCPPWLDGFGCVRTLPALTVSRVYDHHAIIAIGDAEVSIAVGERLAIVPNNANSVLALRRVVWHIDGDGVHRPEQVIGDDWP